MKCKNCKKEIYANDTRCPYCGEASEKQGIALEKYCSNCGNMHQEQEVYCRLCGEKRKIKIAPSNAYTRDTQKEYRVSNVHTDTKKNYLKKPTLWIVTVSVLVVVILSATFMYNVIETLEENGNPHVEESGTPWALEEDIANTDISTFEKVGETSLSLQQHNSNIGGYITQYGDTFYIATASGVIQYTNQFEEQGIVVSKDVSYIHADAQYVYYWYENAYYRIHLESTQEEEILGDIYYPQHIGNRIYYQKDADNESVYVYYIDTREDIKLNDMRSYNITVNEETNTIYYTGTSDAVSGIYRMDIDGQNQTLLVEIDSYYLQYENGILYTLSEGSLLAYDTTGKLQDPVIDSDLVYMFFTRNQDIVYYDYFDGLLLKDGGSTTVSLLEEMEYMQGLGEYTFCWIVEGMEYNIYVVDNQGNCAFLTTDSEIFYDAWPLDDIEEAPIQDF